MAKTHSTQDGHRDAQTAFAELFVLGFGLVDGPNHWIFLVGHVEVAEGLGQSLGGHFSEQDVIEKLEVLVYILEVTKQYWRESLRELTPT